ncbi:hypothetical protein ACFWPK_01195 [Nocardia sp. NPDC058519]|uniref:hypothetical protein n=1 Tax=Nocardia sp. NPDC058519 TaxID=3346535 RepID=UPI003659FC96
MDLGDERALRSDIFFALRRLVEERGGSVTRADLLEFQVGDYPIQLVDRNRGIRNPKGFASTLSIMSKPGSPYEDEVVGDSLFTYDYREGPIDVGDNIKLRKSAETEARTSAGSVIAGTLWAEDQWLQREGRPAPSVLPPGRPVRKARPTDHHCTQLVTA